MQVKVYNQKGEETGKATLAKGIFDLKVNSDLVHQVVVSQASNRRQNTAHSKDRAEVRGGGKKPWRQKGTGRARHGSRRSPLWAGGGITFGPTNERNYKRAIPKKMKRKALLMVLSAKVSNEFFLVLDDLQIKDIKTKEMAKIISSLPCKKESCLVVNESYDKNLLLSTRNLPKTKLMEARELNALDLLNFKYLLTTKSGLKAMERNLKRDSSVATSE